MGRHHGSDHGARYRPGADAMGASSSVYFGGRSGTGVFAAADIHVFPQDESIKTNAELAAEKESRAAAQVAAALDAIEVEGELLTEALADAVAETPGEVAMVEAAENPQALPGMPRPRRPSLWQNLRNGVGEFFSNENPYHRKVALYVLIASLLFTTLTTVQSVPYWALGIELAPSYDGRTRVVTYRSFVDKAMATVAPWILPFCFLPIFFNVIDGLLWYAIIVVAVGAPSTILMVMYTQERMMKSIAKAPTGPGLLMSMWQTGKNIHFLKILFLFQFIGITNGVFAQFMLFLNIYWVFDGDALAGATMGGYVGTLGVIVAILALPMVNWSCRKFQKHRALQYAIIWMSIGSAAKWFIFTPDSPYLQLAMPFFFSIGISAVFTILPTMMADVTDIDELRHGVRREGMFGAVMAFLMKLTGAVQPLLAGAMLIFSGFDVSLGANQTPETIHNMRLLFSLVPAGLLLLALVALFRYPLTREYMQEVKAQLVIARAQRAAANQT